MNTTAEKNQEACCHEHCHGEHDHTHEHCHGEHDHTHAHHHEGCGCGHDHVQHENQKIWIFRLSFGIALFAAGFFVRQPWDFILNLAAYLILGYDVILNGFKNLLKGHGLDENFLMTVASVGAMIIGEYHEGTAVMLFYQIGEGLQERAVEKSRRSITELMDIRPDHANRIEGQEIVTVSPEQISLDDVILIKPGERIPLDGVIIEGASYLDTKALTGESVPRHAKPGDQVLSGCVNLDSVLKCRVTSVFADSAVSRILDMVENAKSKKTKSELFITRFARIYTPVVVALAVLTAVIPPLADGMQFAKWLYRALIFLVVSCPCALVVSVPLGFFAGIGRAAGEGILFKGGTYLEKLSNTKTVVFDKTGTLTKGTFSVSKLDSANGLDVLQYAAMAEVYSDHPIAVSIKQAYGKEIDTGELSDYQVITGKGVRVRWGDRQILAGNLKLMSDFGIHPSKDYSGEIGTVVYVAADGKYEGAVIISDELKNTAGECISQLHTAGIESVMLTGDRQSAAKTVAERLGIDRFYSQLLPDDKVHRFEGIMVKNPQGACTAFVGDGINDAPVLARADVGIAMGGIGADSAIEAADVVIMDDEPVKINLGIKISRKTMRIVKQNIVFAIAVKILVMALGISGLTGMWAAIFADVGVTLIAVCNSVRMLKK